MQGTVISFSPVKEELAEIMHLIPQEPAEPRTAARPVGVTMPNTVSVEKCFKDSGIFVVSSVVLTQCIQLADTQGLQQEDTVSYVMEYDDREGNYRQIVDVPVLQFHEDIGEATAARSLGRSNIGSVKK